MKQKILHKTLIIGILTFSFCSFAYVNAHSFLNRSAIKVTTTEQNARPADADCMDDDRNSTLPARSISLVAKLVELAQKFTPGGR